jgi:hypothetical protein
VPARGDEQAAREDAKQESKHESNQNGKGRHMAPAKNPVIAADTAMSRGLRDGSAGTRPAIAPEEDECKEFK